MCPPLVLTSLPVGPTTIAVCRSRQVAPERYSAGAPSISFQLKPPCLVLAKLFGESAGAAKSPPTAMPLWPFLNASGTPL